MTKHNIFLCLLVAVACVIPTHAANILDKTFGNAIGKAQMKFVEMLNDTADNFKGKINPIVETAIDTLDKMKENGEDIVEDVRFKIGEAVSRMNQRIDELMKMMPNDVDVTECKNMAEGITETGTMILANATFCVTEKIDQASRSIESINAITNDVIITIRDTNEKSTECTKNSAFSLKMVGCMARIMEDSAKMITTKTSLATLDIMKLAYYITTLLPSLALCSFTETVAILINNANAIMFSIDACVNERVSAYYQENQV